MLDGEAHLAVLDPSAAIFCSAASSFPLGIGQDDVRPNPGESLG